MRIETFNKLLKSKNPQGYAYIPEKVGKRQNAVAVVFTPGGKVYTYKGTILAIAERLGLIPEVNVEVESRKAIKSLKETGLAVAPVECSDTINHFLNIPGKLAQEVSRVEDEFGRKIATFEIGVRGEWV